MATDRENSTSGSRLYTEGPWNGSRTPAFLKFKRDFEAGAGAHFLHEDDYSIWQACNDKDQGGQAAGADALPGPQQAGYTNAVRRRKRRQAKAYHMVYMHVDDERLKEMLAALPADDRRGCASWALLVGECDEGTTDLQILSIRTEFENCTIELHVGYNEETVTTFARLLNSINARLPANHKYSEDQMAVKLLCNINHPDSLALNAVTELNASAGARRFEHVVNGNPTRNYRAIVTY